MGFTVNSAPEGFAPDEEWVQHIEDNSGTAIARAYLFLLAGVCLVAFYATGIAPLLPERSSADRALRSIGFAFTVLAATFFAGGGMLGGATSFALEFFDTPVDPAVANTLDKLGLTMVLLAGAISIGLTMCVVAIQSLRSASPARWVGWLSAIAAAGMLGAIFFLPFLLLPIWILAMSVHLLIRRA